MRSTEKLIDDFLSQIDLVGSASPELQQQIAKLLRTKRSVLLATPGRRRTQEIDRRDIAIYQAYLELRKAGNKVKDIEQTLGVRYNRTPERIKSIVQYWKTFLG